jgi:hypothetical protein
MTEKICRQISHVFQTLPRRLTELATAIIDSACSGAMACFHDKEIVRLAVVRAAIIKR